MLLRPRMGRPYSIDEIIRDARAGCACIGHFDESGSGSIHVEIIIAHSALSRMVIEATQDAAPLLPRCRDICAAAIMRDK